MRILVIDDNETIRELMRQILAGEGYEVVTASDGDEGFAVAKKTRPHLVITDVLMPGKDGFQLLRAMRQDPVLKDIPVIFCTGRYLDDEDRDLALRFGVSRYLMKPLDVPHIVKAVKETMAEHAQEREYPAKTGLLDEEPVFLKAYNERLISKLKSSMIEHDQTRLFLEHIMDGIGDGVMVIDRAHRVLAVNAAAAAMLRMKRKEIIGRFCYELNHRRKQPCNDIETPCPLKLILDRGEPIVKALHTHYAGREDERHVELTASPVRDNDGNAFAIVETFRDIMEKRTDDELVKLVKRLNEAQMHLKHMAITDDLTGLRNRRYIVERLDEEYERARRIGDPLSLIMLDIDHFKQINDAYGHPFGDVVLRVLAARIKTTLRRHDIVGRVGGEEFLVVCPASTIEETVIVAERIRNVASELIDDGMKKIRVTLSGGVASLSDEDTDAERLFSRADAALYRAKEQGRNRVVAS